MTTLSGKEFNDKYHDIELYKVLSTDSIHFGFQYKHGLNVDSLPFNPRGECSKGGLYFVSLYNLSLWLNMGIYIARVTLPNDASIYTEENTFKADKIILDLDNKVLISDFYIWKNNNWCIRMINKNGVNLQYIKEQSEEMCKLAVCQNGYALQYVIVQTEEICKLAICKNGDALQFVNDQTKEICDFAVSHDARARRYIRV